MTPQKLAILIALYSLASWVLASAVLKWVQVVKAIKQKGSQ